MSFLEDTNALMIKDNQGDTVFAILHDNENKEFPFVMVVLDEIVINCKADQVNAIIKKCQDILEKNMEGLQ